MRTYARVETAMWHSPKFGALSDDGKMLWVYMISCPHGNLLGCFVLREGYIAADLGWAAERVRQTVTETVSRGLIERCETTSLTRIVGWFGHNKIENPNVGKAAAETFARLPSQGSVYAALVADLRDLCPHFPRSALPGRNPSPNGSGNGMPNPEPEPKPKPEPEPEPEAESESADALSAHATATPPALAIVPKARAAVTQAVDAWNALRAEHWPSQREPALTDARLRKIAARVKDHGLDGWTTAIANIRGSPFLLGKTDKWKATLDWFIESSNFVKVFEGNYADTHCNSVGALRTAGRGSGGGFARILERTSDELRWAE